MLTVIEKNFIKELISSEEFQYEDILQKYNNYVIEKNKLDQDIIDEVVHILWRKNLDIDKKMLIEKIQRPEVLEFLRMCYSNNVRLNCEYSK